MRRYARTLAEAVTGADVFFGLSAPGVLTGEMIKAMARDPLIFAMANPDPEIRPEDAIAARPDAISAPDGRITRTKSTMFSASRSFSAARSIAARPPSTRR